MIRAIYRTRGGKRLVKQALFTCGRKNGKTQLAAALALCHLAGPESEPRGEVYRRRPTGTRPPGPSASSRRSSYADPDLADRMQRPEVCQAIEVMDGEGIGRTLRGAELRRDQGARLSPAAIVMDELAQWRGRELYDNLMTGVGAREEPLVLVISTKAPDPHSVMSEVTDYARQGARRRGD